MDIQLLLVPYDSGQRGWRCGAGPEHLVRAGLPAHLQRQGHVVTAIHIIEDDPAYPPAEIRTAFELARRLALPFGPLGPPVTFRWCSAAIATRQWAP
jgi:hypothetical protein